MGTRCPWMKFEKGNVLERSKAHVRPIGLRSSLALNCGPSPQPVRGKRARTGIMRTLIMRILRRTDGFMPLRHRIQRQTINSVVSHATSRRYAKLKLCVCRDRVYYRAFLNPSGLNSP